jgi:hypothetical protein
MAPQAATALVKREAVEKLKAARRKLEEHSQAAAAAGEAANQAEARAQREAQAAVRALAQLAEAERHLEEANCQVGVPDSDIQYNMHT